MVPCCLPLVYLNVTDLTTYNVKYDSFCIRWAPHRAATSYRLKVNPFDSKCLTNHTIRSLVDFDSKYVTFLFPSLPLASKGGAQEITVRGSESNYCFDNLTPDTLYNATVFTQTPNLEGPGVSVKEKTCKIATSVPI